jgi:hypothetical protein
MQWTNQEELETQLAQRGLNIRFRLNEADPSELTPSQENNMGEYEVAGLTTALTTITPPPPDHANIMIETQGRRLLTTWSEMLNRERPTATMAPTTPEPNTGHTRENSNHTTRELRSVSDLFTRLHIHNEVTSTLPIQQITQGGILNTAPENGINIKNSPHK